MGQSAPSVDWRGPTYERFTQVTEIPLLLLAVALVPILVIPEVSHVHRGEKNILDAIDYGIWAVFLCEYVVRLALARRRMAFIRHNIPDLVLVALPMLRPLRVLRSARALRLLRLGRLAAALRLGTRLSERSLQASAVGYAIVVALALTAACSVMELDLERHAPGANIHSFGDSLWWAATTVSTVGYGDHYPVTAAGRSVALVLIVAGVSLFGVVTAAVAAFFVKVNRNATPDPTTALSTRLDALEAAVARIEAALGTAPAIIDVRTGEDAPSVSV